jgi:hypothetical protein
MMMSKAGATGFEPAISGLTGQHVNRYTTPPVASRIIPQKLGPVNCDLTFYVFTFDVLTIG